MGYENLISGPTLGLSKHYLRKHLGVYLGYGIPKGYLGVT
jgi:hypothetical protein